MLFAIIPQHVVYYYPVSENESCASKHDIHKDHVIPDFRNLAVRDHKLLIAAQKPPKARRPRHDDRIDGAGAGIHLQIADAAEPCAVAQVDDLLSFEVAEVDGSHMLFPSQASHALSYGRKERKRPGFHRVGKACSVSKYSKALSTIAWIISDLPCELILALSGSFRLLLALHAGLLIVLTPANLSKDAGACTLPLESFKSTFQGLIFANTNFHHFPSPLTAT